MCGRFTQAYTWAQIVALHQFTQPALNLEPHHNVAPTNAIDVVILRDDAPTFGPNPLGSDACVVEGTRKEVASTCLLQRGRRPMSLCAYASALLGITR